MNPRILEEIPHLTYAEPLPPPILTEEFRKTVFSRRSVRVFEPDVIPEEVVRDCLELGLLSPNSSNLQPWSFHWVRNPAKKALLINACFSQPAAKTAAELIVCVAHTGTWKRHSKEMVNLLRQGGSEVPQSAIDYYRVFSPLAYSQGFFGLWGRIKQILFFFAGFFRPAPREPVCHADMKLWAAKTCALACQTIMLAFRAHGYDTCPLEGYDSSRIRKLTGIPREANVVMVIAAGKRSARGIYGPRIRFESSRFIREI